VLVGAALLQDRHHQVDEVLEALGGHNATQIEAVDIGFLDPGDQIVGDLLGGADDGRIAATEPHPADDAPQCPGLGTSCRQGLDRRVDRIILDIADWRVRLVAREINAGRAGEMSQRPLDTGVFVIFPVLVFGFAPDATDDGSAVVEDQDFAWVAPMRRSAGADVGDEIAGDALVCTKHEDAFGMCRGELSPAVEEPAWYSAGVRCGDGSAK
jgi:hypothetical protein